MPIPAVRLYVYDRCDTCRKALKFLQERGIPYEAIPIRDQPPAPAELKKMLQITGNLRRLFNTSGGDFRELDLKSRLPQMGAEEALTLLASCGNLVKRPFLLIPGGGGAVGFQPEEWERLLADPGGQGEGGLI